MAVDREYSLLFTLVCHKLWLSGGDGDAVVVVGERGHEYELRNMVMAFNDWQTSIEDGRELEVPMTGPVIDNDFEGDECLFFKGEATLLFVIRDRWECHRDIYPSWCGSCITVYF